MGMCSIHAKLNVVVIFYFSSQDAQANLPSCRGRDVPSSHKKRIWCDDREKKRKKKKEKKGEKEEKEETQPRAELEANVCAWNLYLAKPDTCPPTFCA